MHTGRNASHLTSLTVLLDENLRVLAGLQEGNLHPKDLSSTEGYQRDSVPQFIM